MASRLTHLATAKPLEQRLDIADKERFEIGIILPDAVILNKNMRADSHFAELFDNGKFKHYDAFAFYEKFSQLVMTDALYLGYYFHLIEDNIFRTYLYDKMYLGLIGRRGEPELLEELYRDYHTFNRILVRKFGLEDNLSVPQGFSEEPINCIYPFELQEFLEQMSGDFTEHYECELIHFTEELYMKMTDECVEVCAKEYAALRNGTHFLDRYAYSFENKYSSKVRRDHK